MGWASRISKAWKALQATEDDLWYLVEDMSPVGFRIQQSFGSRQAAMDWRRAHADRMHTFQIVLSGDWEVMAANLMRDRRFWAAWGDLSKRARMGDERHTLEKARVMAALADRGPETGGITASTVYDGQQFDPLDLREVAERAQGRNTPAKGIDSQSLPEGVTWDDES